MYNRVEDNLHMPDVEACERFPDSYIIIRRDSMNNPMGTVLYVGDNEDEIYSLRMSLSEPFCGVVEGLNIRRNCLGGVVIGG